MRRDVADIGLYEGEAAAARVSSAPSAEMSAPTRSNPFCARATQLARPIPRRAPVTSAAGFIAFSP